MKKILIYLIINLIIFNGCDVESVKENTLPTPPVLSAPSNNATNINIDATLNWTASTDGNGDALKYNVYFGTENPPTIKVKELQNEISYTPTLKSNTTYYWKIEANDGKGGVSVSEVWNFKTIIIPPSVPSLIDPVTLATNISLTPILTWSASTSSSGFTIKYNVFFESSSSPLTSSTLTKKVSNLQTSTSYTITTSLLSNTTYYWKIEADDRNGGVGVSEIGSFKTLIVLPSKPVLNAPENNTINISLTPNLTWSASTTTGGYPIKYNVFLDTSSTALTSSTLTKKVSSLQTSTSYTPPTLISNANYYWKIEADDGNGGVATSEINSFKTVVVPPSVPILTAPVNGAIEETLTPTFEWFASISPSGYNLKYNVYLGTEKTSITKVSSVQPDTFFMSMALTQNTKYYWKIEADDGNGVFIETEIDSFVVIIFDTINVEGGTFTMGCTSEQGSNCDNDEKPAHLVTLSNFSIGKYEVTQAQWLNVMGSNPSIFTNCNDCPVDNVSWNDIQTFLTTLNTKTGKSYRLPTEAEWEYVARGGKKSAGYKYSGSNDVGSVAWYYVNSGSKTHSIGTKTGNELGIYDMSGNVWEWCSDFFGNYTSESITNPTGPSLGFNRILRGGSWYNNPVGLRVSNRLYIDSNDKGNDAGFRLLLP